VDGGLKTGRDVVVAAMLGAEEFGFATGVVVAIGCDMARQCHLNTCPTGIATQREDLRKKFAGTPDMVVNYFTLIAEEVRQILATLGARSLEEIVGRADLLKQVPSQCEPLVPDEEPRWETVDLEGLLVRADTKGVQRHFVQSQARLDGNLNQRMVADARPAIEHGVPVRLAYDVRSSDRTIGATLAGEVALRYGGKRLPEVNSSGGIAAATDGLPEGAINIQLTGSAGQSFGAFAVRGMRLSLTGEANDYVGKGLSGGEISIRPSARATYTWSDQVIAGNTILYGATGGRLFLAGRAGERFAVRNSGALGVVEGIGDHGCEYMTSGLVVILGDTGRNFAAGMSAGRAYVLDVDGSFPSRVNTELVSLERLREGVDEDEATLVEAVRRHLEATDSPRAAEILVDWQRFAPLFWKVVPHPPVVTTESPTVLATRKR
jgi:glutamate synthase domain-containing protein 3